MAKATSGSPKGSINDPAACSRVSKTTSEASFEGEPPAAYAAGGGCAPDPYNCGQGEAEEDSPGSKLQGIHKLILRGLAILFLLAALTGCVSTAVQNQARPPDAAFRECIVDYAVTLLGKPYRNGAKGPDAFDCSGYVYFVYSRFGIVMPVSTEGLSKAGREVSREDVVMADLAIFSIKGDRHVGIMINSLEFVHASKSKGVMIDSIDAPYWKKNFSHFQRVF
jgi:hypothetical protein